MRILITFICLLLLGNNLAAEVLIYSGTYREQSGIEPFFPPGKTYFVFDTESKSYAFIYYYQQAGKKLKRIRSQGTFMHMGSVYFSNGKDGTVLTGGFAGQNQSGQYYQNVIALRGYDNRLNVGGPTPEVFLPRVLTGAETEMNSNYGGTAFRETRFSLTFNFGLTKKANDSQQSYPIAVETLYERLHSQGYR